MSSLISIIIQQSAELLQQLVELLQHLAGLLQLEQSDFNKLFNFYYSSTISGAASTISRTASTICRASSIERLL